MLTFYVGALLFNKEAKLGKSTDMSVEIRDLGDKGCEVVGFLNEREVICIDYSIGKWTISMSRNLPLELSDARKHIAVLNAALAEVDRLEANGRISPHIAGSYA
jgi:hypothetical protein